MRSDADFGARSRADLMHQNINPAPDDPQVTESQAVDPPDCADHPAEASRREFLVKSARRAAYVAPVVLLFHPKRACASNGSTLTYWDGEQIQHK